METDVKGSYLYFNELDLSMAEDFFKFHIHIIWISIQIGYLLSIKSIPYIVHPFSGFPLIWRFHSQSDTSYMFSFF